MSLIEHKPLERRAAPSEQGRIMLAHGGGGQLTDELINHTILPRLGNADLDELLDAAEVTLVAAEVALTIDSYVVQPLQFPGGDIGRLSICGTVNDLAVTGAEPLAIALSMIVAEGFDRHLLGQILDSVRATADEADVRVVTGDTKVVPATAADGIYLTTAGIGRRIGPRLHPRQIRPGDRILINGPIADHGLAVMLAREMPHVQSPLRSDIAPLNSLIRRILEDVPTVAFMRDPTRGGLAGVVAEVAQRQKLHVTIDERQIPLRPETWHAAEMLGLDPLEVANEGKVVAFVRPDTAEQVLQIMRDHPLGREAAIIGQVDDDGPPVCEVLTRIGGRRVLHKPYGEQLPRIC